MPVPETVLKSAFDLSRLPSSAPPETDREALRAALATLGAEFARQQELLYANRRQALLVLLQGMDASGKDSTLRRVFCHASPSGLSVHAFRAPGAEERAHDFLWRVHRRLPERGMIGAFNRSHYEAVVYDPVQGLCSETERQRRLASIRDFERHLAGSGTLVCKIFLHVGKAEQKKRLIERITDPTKHWKLGPDDLRVRGDFDRYLSTWGETMEATHAPEAPWHVIPADQRSYRDYRVLSVLVETLQGLKLEYPALATPLTPGDVPD